MLYQYTLYPLECVYKFLYLLFSNFLGSYGHALFILSLAIYLTKKPLTHWAEGLQNDEKELQDILKPQIERIKNESKGAEQYNRIKSLYTRYGYHPIMAIRSLVGLLLQLPFIIAAFYMLETLEEIRGVQYAIFADLGKPDGLLFGINIMPFLMTSFNFISVFTTPSFTRKDKIQGIVVAILFLVMLYDSPSALLIYWTCNNFLTMLDTLVSMFDKELRRIHWFDKICLLVNYIIHEQVFGLSLLFSITAFLVIPSNLYIANINEFALDYYQVAPLLLEICSLSFLVVAAIGFLSNTNQCVKNIYFDVIFGLALGCFVQVNFLNYNLPTLNGTTVKWDYSSMDAIISLICWGLCLVLPFCVRNYRQALYPKLQKVACVGLILIQLVVLSMKTDKTVRTVANDFVVTEKEEFVLSKNKNIVVFVVDTLDTKWFEDYVLSDKRLATDFKDFIYFNNIVGGGAPTVLGMPAFFTGILYNPEVMNLDQYYLYAYDKSTFFADLKKQGYITKLYTEREYLNHADYDNIYNVSDSSKYEIKDKIHFSKYLVKLSAYAGMPYHLKKKFWFYGGDLSNLIKADSMFELDDPRMYGNYKEQGLTFSNNNPVFVLYHMFGAHGPAKMDENCNPVDFNKLSEKDKNNGSHMQIRGSFKFITEFINEMKQNNCYDNSDIVIMADHGGLEIYQAPTVVYKPAQKNSNKIEINSTPKMFRNLRASLASAAGINTSDINQYGSGLLDNIDEFSNTVRPHTADKVLRNSIGFSKKSIVRSHDRYYVGAVAHDIKQITDIPEGKKMYSFEISELPQAPQYKIGQLLKSDTMNNYICGLSDNEGEYCWSNGKKVNLDILKMKKQDLNLMFKYTGVFGGSQRVVVKANNLVISDYVAQGAESQSIKISKDIISNEKLNITIELPDAKSPASLGISADARVLGLALSEFCVIASYDK